MAQFDIGFTDAMRGIADFNMRLSNMGHQLDTMEKSFTMVGSAAKEVFGKTGKAVEKITKSVKDAGHSTEDLGKKLEEAERHVASLFQKMAAENAKATLAMSAYNGEMGALGRMLNDTASKNTYVQWQQKTLQLTNKLTGENQFLRKSIAEMNGTLGKDNANLKLNLSFKQSLATATQRLRNQGTQLALTYSQVNSEQGRSNILTQSHINARRRQITEDARASDTLQTLKRTLKSLDNGTQEQITKVQQLIAARKAQITETARETTEIERLKREHASLNGGLQEEIAKLRSINTIRKAVISEVLREEAEIAKLKRQHDSLNGGLQEEIIKLRAVNNARKQAITEATREKVVVDEQARALAREQAQLLKLQQQMALVSSGRGLEITKLRQQIIDQERYNRVLAKSTMELLGFSRAQSRASNSNIVGSQAAAMLRASLGGLQANIGMYTSGTILAAAATYALARALRSTVEIGSEFTASMAKADAIMSTGLQSWMPSDMGAMEMQVRALGQSTMYTASEVALGLVELGQAGLSSADSIMALKPALNLAMIGSISMAQSADIATNVMMTFGMEARNLTDIVDMMATAASQSNTNVEQLANALTYAGPAAHTAGISMKDTTAAIEALANTGIKASRAGTGLRKLFTSLLNPTKKGKAMMDEYGISVTDMEGKTKSLTDILGQLHDKLKDVSEAQRLAAIQNLVGLYATSPVAALVGQAGDGGNLEHLRRQLEDTSGAAEEMRAKMENSLKFDWKQVISAFEEAQLQLFDAHEYQLRTATAKLSLYLIELTKPAKELKDEYGNVTATFSELDMMLQRGKEAAEGLAYAMGGIIAFKIAGSAASALGALAIDARTAATNLKVLALGFADGSRGSLTLTGALTGLKANLTATAIGVRTLYTQVGLLGTAAVVGARALSAMAAAAGMLMRALGWVGIIYGIGSALYAAFGQDSTAKIIAQKNEVGNLKNEYQGLKSAIDATAAARERASLENQIENELGKLGKINERKYEVEGAADQYTAAGLQVPQSLKDELWEVEFAAGKAAQAIQDAGAERDKLEDPGKRLKIVDADLAGAKELARLKEAAAAAEQTYHDAEGRMRLGQLDAWNAAKEAVDSFTQSLVQATEQSNTATKQAADALGIMARLRNEQTKSLQDYNYTKQSTDSQKLQDVQRELITARQDLEKASKAGDGDIVERRQKDIISLQKKEYDLNVEIRKTTEAYNDTKDAIANLSATDEERLTKAKASLAELMAAQAQPTPFASKGMETEANLATAKEELKLRQEIKQLESTVQKAGAKGSRNAASDENADLAKIKAAQSAYDTLAKKIDPVTHAQRELAKGTKAMTLLRGENLITTEQQILATGQLNLAYYEAVKGLDKNRVALDALKASYNTSPFLDTAADLAILKKSFDDGALSLSEYIRLTDRLETKRKEAAINGLPTANLSVGDASSSPFTDWTATEVERAQGLGQFEKRRQDIGMGEQDQLAGLNDQFTARMDALNAQKLIEQGAEAEHTRKMIEIQENFQRERMSIIDTAAAAQTEVTTKQTEYAEQMSTMALSAAMGTVSNVLATFASASADATTAQKIAFVAQKAIAVAQILMYTHLAAAQALTIPGDTTKAIGGPLAAFIMGTGYANAGLVAALAIGELSGGGKSGGGGGGGGTQMYDTGGFIPYNRTGIVGEYGPELVSGPTHVTGRGNSAAKLSGAGGDAGSGITIQISPQVNVESGAGQSPEDAKRIGETVSAICVTEIAKQIRPNGILDNWYRNKQQRS